VATRKHRIISLRLSDAEYESLKSRYASHGACSLSEFARDAMHRMLGDDPLDGVDIEDRVKLLGGKVAALERKVSRLSHVLETELAGKKTP
jgi:hypothetical protein